MHYSQPPLTRDYNRQIPVFVTHSGGAVSDFGVSEWGLRNRDISARSLGDVLRPTKQLVFAVLMLASH
jgi:hypothetical protein